ncbi:MAG: hypothetical protein KF819_03255 [Labilithrix sp.]|nr:hypothetical protein [Labilithrix sp.]
MAEPTLKDVLKAITQVDKRFDAVDKRFDALESEVGARFDAVDERFDRVDAKLGHDRPWFRHRRVATATLDEPPSTGVMCRSSVVAVTFLMLVAPACPGTTTPESEPAPGETDSSTTTEAGADGRADGRSPCSVGDPYTFEDYRALPYVPGVVPLEGPYCVPRCAYARDERPELDPGRYYLDALPRGACAVDGERCFMAVQITCGRCNSFGPRAAFRCDCIGGAWSCAETDLQGATGCPVDDCPDLDASSD